jgi:hypothetical protein
VQAKVKVQCLYQQVYQIFVRVVLQTVAMMLRVQVQAVQVLA